VERDAVGRLPHFFRGDLHTQLPKIPEEGHHAFFYRVQERHRRYEDDGALPDQDSRE